MLVPEFIALWSWGVEGQRCRHSARRHWCHRASLHAPLCAPTFAVVTKSLSDETVGVIRDLHI